ncbi:hypothetical protein A3J78_02525 [Candidatus Beckwithbacteria bacterium RBG_13_35_6]|uniref:AB hydrolase-1 domain-containing protein n=1 Tax=Candidatus Beckwithbacteria bacterium RBG_13_35_6 TaxID=1797456 RepID=A0A1F5DEZ5_9BACT|nr:MAG: hypothetical protein A3J78_02525 [Candidatus Beckwithbacteria bacterium RBG_13_35_6]
MVENETSSVLSRKSYIIDSSVGKFPVIEVSLTQPKADIPVVIAPGWSEPPDVFDSLQSVMAERGRRSFSFDHPRLGGKVEPRLGYSTPELRKALALLDLVEHTGSDKVDIVAHSEGAVYAVIAASLKPEKFRNMILVGPGGMIGKDTLTALLGRFTKKVARNLLQGIKDPSTTKTIIHAHIGAGKYIATNPVRALSEAVAISKSNIGEMLPQLRSRGVGIVIIHHAGDEAFPMQRIQQVAQPKQMDGILAVTGLHDDLYIHPEKYAAAAEEMLSVLERKQSYHTTNSSELNELA